MAAWDNTGGTAFEQAPVGNHTAICIGIIDLGTQTGEYKGEETKRRQVLMTWELPEELRDDGQPFIISKFYTRSLGEKANLTKDLISWLGKMPELPFDPKALLGKGCNLTVTEREGTGKRVVSAVSSLKKNEKVGEPHNPITYFDLDEFDEKVFEGLSKGIVGMIEKSPEYARIMAGEDPAENVEPDKDEVIPF